MTEYKHRLIHKDSHNTHLAKQSYPDSPFYKTLCGLSINPRWVMSKFKLGCSDEEITCRRCLKKMEAKR